MSVHSSKVRNAMNHKPAGSRPVSASPSAPTPRPALASRLATLVRGHRAGLFALAFAVGIGSGLGAVAFRYLVYGITWLMTGQTQFGQAGHAPSSHAAFLGVGFFVVAPVLGGLLYGPLIQRFAPEARGHGVPEVMAAVAQNGGRIRARVSIVKAFTSALTIGTGGSVGREGPIAQIGASMASALGQGIRIPENRLRVICACGAGGAIAATFNTPLAGLFFGIEIILRTYSVDALFAVMVSTMVADATAIAFVGNETFLVKFPHDVSLDATAAYAAVAGLAGLAALAGLLFSRSLYALEDAADRVWGDRPQWLKPVVGGVLVGALLLALPQLYGVGYPVMYRALGGSYAVWFLFVLAAGKILATGLTLAVGGSGGVYAPSLFIGLMLGTAYGLVTVDAFGPGVGDPAVYAAVGMAAVFAAATRSPLTAVASVVEMTGDFKLVLPVMLAVSIATVVSRRFSYGTIYTTKLLRRGQDIDRAVPWRAFTDMTAEESMRGFASPMLLPGTRGGAGAGTAGPGPDGEEHDVSRLQARGSGVREPAGVQGSGGVQGSAARGSEDAPPTARGAVQALDGELVIVRAPQIVFANEPVTDVFRQLDAYSRDGMPVVSTDTRRILGWITPQSIAHRVHEEMSAPGAERGPAHPRTDTRLAGLQVAEVLVPEGSAAVGRPLGSLDWPEGCIPVALQRDGSVHEAEPADELHAGDTVNVLIPASNA